ncbi:MAG TPA: type II secretion system F family protein [Pseudonocardiaceae bacterium]|nr:type II secretion system F family protein [Pseudonocardiaceae bacterium]
MITAGVLFGTGLGVGIWALLGWLRPPPPSLARALATARATAPAAHPTATTGPVGWAARVGAPVARLLAALGLPGAALRRDLRLLDRAPEAFLAQKAVLALTGLLLPTLAQAVLLAGGVGVAWPIPLLVGLGCAAGGFVLPDLDVRRRAARHRASARHALAAYLNLIRITLAGGAGVEGALVDAASVGHGPTFAELRRALTTARLSRTTPWATLAQLGADLDIRELVELASALSLAGAEGAKVRASLAAKAAAMRARELTDAEGEAYAATERMSVPVVVLFAGFLVFLGYPAVVTVLSGL